MARARKRSRLIITGLAVLFVGAGLVAAFWPQPVLVDMAKVTRGPMQVTIEEEGRTRVDDIYVVSTPVAGFLQRVDVLPGDPVTARDSVVARMLPTNPAALDARTREQALAVVDAAMAALDVARAGRSSAEAAHELAQLDLTRVRTLAASGTVSQAALDRAETNARAAEAELQTMTAGISMREADLATAQAQLIGFDDLALAEAVQEGYGDAIALHAPITGRILRVLQQSEAVLPAGTPILEIGDIAQDLDVVVELISADAVQVGIGDAVLIENWGGPGVLNGRVARIAPYGVTKLSALGVEEQRVEVTIQFTDSSDARVGLGHGYRVDTQIVIWSNPDALKLPSAALFRDQSGWAVFVATADGTAQKTTVEIGANNGIDAEILSGLTAGQSVVLYPPAGLASGVNIASREEAGN